MNPFLSPSRVASAFLAQEDLVSNFAPFVPDPLRDDLDGLVDTVLDSFRTIVRKRFQVSASILKPLDFQGKQIQHYGFSKYTKRGLEGAEVSGEIVFPKTATLGLSGSLDLQKIWMTALEAGAPHYTKGVDYKQIERNSKILIGIVEQEAFDALGFYLLPREVVERLEDEMFSYGHLADDSNTTYTDYNGEREETVEGVGITHVFTYDVLDKQVRTTKKGPNALIVSMEVRVGITLLKSEPQW